MNLTFQSGTTLVIFDGTKGRELLVSSCSISQTMLAEARVVKTIQNLHNVAETFFTEKSVANLEFDMYLTPTDSILFEWYGCTKVGNKYYLNTTGNTPNMYDVYIKANGSLYKVDNAAIGNMVFSFDGRASPLKVSINATASSVGEVSNLPAGTYTKQSSLDFFTGSLSFNSVTSYISGITLDATRTVTWRNSDKYLQDTLAGAMYQPKLALITDLAIGGSLTTYKTGPQDIQAMANQPVTISYGDRFVVGLGQCSGSYRLDVSGEVHKVQLDFKLQAFSSVYMEFL